MRTSTPFEIKVFISCPGDVAPEKQIVKEICRKLNLSFYHAGKNVRYMAFDWKDLAGEIGKRSQEQINIYFKDYDIYLGIFGTRFGADTGKINEATGEDFGSGTVEKFYSAYDCFKNDKSSVKIYVFFQDTYMVNNEMDTKELERVLEFKKEVEQLGWRNSVSTLEEFQHTIYTLLSTDAEKTLEKLQTANKSIINRDLVITVTKDIRGSGIHRGFSER